MNKYSRARYSKERRCPGNLGRICMMKFKYLETYIALISLNLLINSKLKGISILFLSIAMEGT